MENVYRRDKRWGGYAYVDVEVSFLFTTLLPVPFYSMLIFDDILIFQLFKESSVLDPRSLNRMEVSVFRNTRKDVKRDVKKYNKDGREDL